MHISSKEKNNKKNNIELITTHINADFDGIASMLAVSKIYKKALLVLPDIHEHKLYNFYVNSLYSSYNFVKLSDINYENVSRIIIVDTHQRNRIG